jgi:hypothetical protein
MAVAGRPGCERRRASPPRTRFYLERFANERMQVTTVDRRTRARRNAAISETVAEKDFYTAINTEGAKDGKSEHLLSHIEDNAARAIKNILNPVFPLFPPRPQGRADLCLFLAFQKVRGKLIRKRIEMLGDLWAHLQIPADMAPEQARAWLQANEQEARPESVQEMVEFSGSMEDFEFVPDPNAHLSVMGSVALRISELLLPRPWWIAEYDSPALLTSDEPVALHFRDRSRPQVMTGASPTPTRSGFPSTRVGCSSWADPATRCPSSGCARQPRPP